jgi:hypothetical protein
LIFQVPIGISSTNWYFKYQLVFEILIAFLKTLVFEIPFCRLVRYQISFYKSSWYEFYGNFRGQKKSINPGLSVSCWACRTWLQVLHHCNVQLEFPKNPSFLSSRTLRFLPRIPSVQLRFKPFCARRNCASRFEVLKSEVDTRNSCAFLGR